MKAQIFVYTTFVCLGIQCCNCMTLVEHHITGRAYHFKDLINLKVALEEKSLDHKGCWSMCPLVFRKQDYQQAWYNTNNWDIVNISSLTVNS